VPRRLLMLSCSKRKRSEEGLLPAIERYDGPFFRVLRRYLRTCLEEAPGSQEQPETYILSAEFGLIPANHPIPFYERRMTPERAEALRPSVLEKISQLLTQGQPVQEIFICLGRDYQHALDGWEAWRPPALALRNAHGSIGMRQAQLRDWLYGMPPPPAPIRQRGTARIRGIEVNLSPVQVLEVARLTLRKDGKNAASFHTWYVQVDSQRVAPKWLVSQLTGLPVNAFVTDEARRVLGQLGIEVMRT
jgi:hypothetical protein